MTTPFLGKAVGLGVAVGVIGSSVLVGGGVAVAETAVSVGAADAVEWINVVGLAVMS
ncbi:MAG: hypothetical protein KC419_24685 [Anaerolineales bacterium]|nr:hypothetical protein [Anaerolineales bacterium]